MPIIRTDLERRLYDALVLISKHYQTPKQIKKSAEPDWGVGYEEALEMAYENIQQVAKNAIKGVRVPKVVLDVR